MSSKFIRSHMLCLLWLFMAIAALAQDSAAVLDTMRNPFRADVEYYVLPVITDVGGRVTLADRNDSCPLFVGQQRYRT
ncbi:hypothetical protein L6164_022719 [Bauhinia variegata]|uniref:Uncharacterized protein n=1 Tax=Bauhinia variegata TaxID=167791 RepID=A0ACB9MGP7_BAUVA|nr:hypothetical protein L6164_022719 [Bauhinia variegata]